MHWDDSIFETAGDLIFSAPPLAGNGCNMITYALSKRCLTRYRSFGSHGTLIVYLPLTRTDYRTRRMVHPIVQVANAVWILSGNRNKKEYSIPGRQRHVRIASVQDANCKDDNHSVKGKFSLK